ncbi:MAG: FkbM family methyltransferase [Candidatus Omnitrophica bacterium]|nr:FkbM family methyltransferase [Candidatus Omnitrophota bacterium]
MIKPIRLAFSNDCDLMSWDGYRRVHAFLDSLGLSAGDSFWLFDPSGSEMALFRQDTEHLGPRHRELMDAINAGRLDILHSVGSYGAPFNRGYKPSRKLTEQGLAYLKKHGKVPKIWTNHGDACNIQNIGGAFPSDYHHGDDPKDEAFILDLLLDYGVEFFWLDRLLVQDVHEPYRLCDSEKCRSGHVIKTFRRFWGLTQSPNANNLCAQIRPDRLEAIRRLSQNTVIYTHWGLHHGSDGKPFMITDELPFSEESQKALGRLANYNREGKISVMRLYDVLTEEPIGTAKKEKDQTVFLKPARSGSDGLFRTMLGKIRRGLRPVRDFCIKQKILHKNKTPPAGKQPPAENGQTGHAARGHSSAQGHDYFLQKLSQLLPPFEISFFLQIKSSGTISGEPYVELYDGSILFGASKAGETYYGPIFEQHAGAFESIGLKREAFGAAFDAMISYHYENVSSYLKKSFFIRPDSGVFDIGVRGGQFLVKASRLTGPRGQVIAVDGTSYCRDRVALHQKYNHLSNVRFVEAVVGDQNNKETVFYTDFGVREEAFSGIYRETYDKNGQAVVKKEHHRGSFPARMKTLDAIVGDLNLDRCDLVILQINGAEVLAVQGMGQTLRRFRPLLFITCYHQDGRSGDSLEGILAFVKAYDYEMISHAGSELILAARKSKLNQTPIEAGSVSEKMKAQS